MSTCPPNGSRFSQTKIVATLGPASANPTMIEALLVAGVDVFRLNMAHGTPREHAPRLSMIRDISRQVGQPVAVLADLAGPKIRLGELPGGERQCHAGEQVKFVRGELSQAADELTTTYAPLVDELAVGDRVLLADGTIILSVESRGPDFAECRVVQPGKIRSRQGVNLPGVKLSATALSEVDRENALWAAQVGIDFVGLSFVRRADEVHQLKELLATQGAPPQVIAKIEKPEAMHDLAAIVAAADGLMVARGDLGVETDIAQVALAQKQIVAACRRAGKPVIVATQMLDSMQHSSLPTRAEVSDVANAILDGADACMLSGETAIGEYPREAVQMMHRIALAAEGWDGPRPPLPAEGHVATISPITQSTVRAAGQIAEEVGAKLVVVATASGATALALAKLHFRVPTLGISNSEATLRRICLYYGVIPLPGVPMDDPRKTLQYITDWGRRNSCLTAGDHLVMVSGTGLPSSAHNQIVLHRVP
jgi:pyruvate kinase